MKVNIQAFNEADENEKAELLWKHGEFIVARPYYGRKVSLYLMPGFYVETYYNHETNEIEKVAAVGDIKMLEKYLVLIELASLTN